MPREALYTPLVTPCTASVSSRRWVADESARLEDAMIATVSTTDTDLTLQADRETWEWLLAAVPRQSDPVEHQAWTAGCDPEFASRRR